MQLWQGRFKKSLSKTTNDFNSSISFDSRMFREDIQGSIAHATMLGETGIIKKEESLHIVEGLKGILEDLLSGKLHFDMECEDIHTFIEGELTKRIGDDGKRLHTARSRNDQVAVDIKLYLRHEVEEIISLLKDLIKVIASKAKEYYDTVMPGYTHLQRAQPILFSHHMMAYFSMLKRDFDRFRGVYERCDIMPLGAGALAGTTFPIDRPFVAEQLNFDAIYSNSLDAVSDRDYIMEFLSAASILMVHLSRLSEETILWCSREFFFIELDDAHCTGSSMMPQKKNPDVSELVRGKTGRVMGHLMAMLTTVKGLPLAYNKDLQEDKEGIFDAIDTIKFSLAVYARILRGMKVRKDVMRRAVAEDFSNATDLADYLVKKGMPFRQAHAVSGKAVHYCIEQGKWLADMSMEEFQKLSDLFAEDIYEAISPETCVKNRNSYGGTSYQQVEMQLQLADKLLEAEQGYITEKDAKQAKVQL